MDEEIVSLTEAIALRSAPAPAPIVKAIEQREAEKRDLQAKLGQLRPRKTIAPERLERAIVDSLITDLGTTPASTQKTLSRLLTKPILVYYDGPGAWHADIEASFAKVEGRLDDQWTWGGGQADVKTTVTVGGAAVGGKWCPRGDSNTRHAV